MGGKATKQADSAAAPVLIVGGGFSGALLAINLVRQGIPVTLFERNEQALAKGLAFGTRRPEHLLNVRASNMSAFPDDAAHFLRWMGFSGAEQANRFVPRLAYGRYLRELLIDTLASAQGRLVIRSDHVIDAGETARGAQAVLANGTVVPGRAVVLALGNFPPRLPAVLASLPAPLAQADPWAEAALDDLDRDAPVLLVGTGLTAVDVILTLDRAGHRGPITALSRRGLVPRRHLDAGPECQPVPLPAARGSALVRAVRARAERVGWRTAIDELRPHTHTLWRLHSPTTQARFLRHARPWWDVHRHRLAPVVAARLDALIAQDQVRFAAGRITGAHAEQGQAIITWLPRHGECKRAPGTGRSGNQPETLSAARVINCIGPEGDIAQARQPLLRALLERGTIRPDAHRLGLDVDPMWRVCGTLGVPAARIFAVGPLTKGIAWEMIAVPDIRRQVWGLAQTLSGRATSADAALSAP